MKVSNTVSSYKETEDRIFCFNLKGNLEMHRSRAKKITGKDEWYHDRFMLVVRNDERETDIIQSLQNQQWDQKLCRVGGCCYKINHIVQIVHVILDIDTKGLSHERVYIPGQKLTWTGLIQSFLPTGLVSNPSAFMLCSHHASILKEEVDKFNFEHHFPIAKHEASMASEQLHLISTIPIVLIQLISQFIF